MNDDATGMNGHAWRQEFWGLAGFDDPARREWGE